MAKIIAHAPTREQALEKLLSALSASSIYGIETNLDYLRTVLGTAVFREGKAFTRFLAVWMQASAKTTPRARILLFYIGQ